MNAPVLPALKVVPPASPAVESAQVNSAIPKTILSIAEVLALPPQTWLVDKIIPSLGIGVMFGPPGSGKTFAALNLGLSIGSGENWFGYKTKKRPVVYLAAEGVSGLSGRLRAHVSDLFGFDSDFHVIPRPPIFCKDSNARAGGANQVCQIIEGEKIKPGLIVVDTLARVFDGDENGSEDMKIFIDSCELLSRRFECFVLIIHHSGKDAERGSRGHSSLKGALDVEIEVRESNGIHSLKIVKQKDGERIEPMSFILQQVIIGKTEDGEPVTSCVVKISDAPAVLNRPPQPRGTVQKLIYELAGTLLKESVSFGQAGSPSNRPCIRTDTLQDKYCQIGNGRTASPTYFKRTFLGMVSHGILCEKEGWLWCP